MATMQEVMGWLDKYAPQAKETLLEILEDNITEEEAKAGKELDKLKQLADNYYKQQELF